jgi:hypothetical protein
MHVSILGCCVAFVLLSGCNPKSSTKVPIDKVPIDKVPIDKVPVGSPSVRTQAVPPEIEPASTAGSLAKPSDTSFRILAWNIESEGADIDVIAEQVVAMDRYDLYGFTEVRPQEWGAIKDALGDGYVFWYSKTGYNDRTAYAISKERFEVIKKYEMGKFGDIILNPGNYRSPHVYELRDRKTDTEFAIVLNHLARGKEEIRQRQAEGIRQWAASMTIPVIAIGDYNFDYVFATEKGNKAFDIFMSDDTWTWVKPDLLVDSNWFDGDHDGIDDFPGSILDFAFVAGDAKAWNPKSRVIVRDGDFPDDERTSDHRPIELIVTP